MFRVDKSISSENDLLTKEFLLSHCEHNKSEMENFQNTKRKEERKKSLLNVNVWLCMYGTIRKNLTLSIRSPLVAIQPEKCHGISI